MAATRVLVMDMDVSHFQGIKKAQALIVINDKAGTFTSAQMYDGNLGSNYDPERSNLTKALPAPNDSRWKEWMKRGYQFGRVEDFDVLAPMGELQTA